MAKDIVVGHPNLLLSGRWKNQGQFFIWMWLLVGFTLLKLTPMSSLKHSSPTQHQDDEKVPSSWVFIPVTWKQPQSGCCQLKPPSLGVVRGPSGYAFLTTWAMWPHWAHLSKSWDSKALQRGRNSHPPKSRHQSLNAFQGVTSSLPRALPNSRHLPWAHRERETNRSYLGSSLAVHTKGGKEESGVLV